MMAILLAGGKGTRLKPFTMTIPKPLLPLGDTPILEVVIRQLSAAGIGRIVLCLGHMAPLFTAVIGNGDRWGVSIEYSFEDEPLGTAGPIRMVHNLERDFLVMNGDVFTTLNYRDLLSFHLKKGAWGTIGLSKREVNIDYGVVECSPEGFLRDYIEKPTIPYAVSMGVNVLSHECVAFIPETGKFDIPQLMLAMHRAGKPVVCYESGCYWQDIGRFDDYQRASDDFVTNPARFLPRGEAARCGER
jgi:NDP-sugar pyrophosphorylase family protein